MSFPNQAQHMPSYGATICDFLNKKVIPKMERTHLESYVLDLVLLESGDVKVIEVNPLAEFAGTGLFQWHIPEDAKVLRGEKEFEFRYAKKIPNKEQILSGITPVFKRFIKNL